MSASAQPEVAWAARVTVFPQLFGKYVLEREIASGGMARVYLATLRGAVGFEKRLVVKQIRPELASDQAFVRRFVVEAKTTVELSHPNIVPVYELGVEQGVYYIAMELCAGMTLAEILASLGPLSPAEGAYLGVEICRALDYAHRRAGIVHRDVTPRNVLVDEEGAVRLIDFGIAAPAAALGEIFGSPGHMPPEQLAGKPLSPATDVFAVAVLLVEAWTGKAVFRRKTAKACEQALNEPVPPLEERVPELAPLSELFARSLALDVAIRPTDAEQLSRPLREFLRPFDVGDIARRLGERVRRTTRRSRRPSPSSGLPRTADGPETPALPDSNPAASERISSVGSEPTYTFAAREEVAGWTRQFGSGSDAPPSSPAAAPISSPSAALPSSGPSTRKLPSIPPSQPPPAPIEAESDSELVGLATPARAKDSGRVSDGAEAMSVEPPLVEAAVEVTSRSSWRLRGVIAAAALSALVLALGVTRARREAESRGPAQRAAKAPTLDTLAQPPVPARAPAVPDVPVDAVVARPAPPAPQTAPIAATSASAAPSRAARGAPSGARSAAPPSSAAATASAAPAPPASVSSAVLRLTADPPAAVSLEGPSGPRALMTPVRELKVAAGTYILTFRNETYGQPVVTRVTVGADVERSVHVDFREVEPRVTVR